MLNATIQLAQPYTPSPQTIKCPPKKKKIYIYIYILFVKKVDFVEDIVTLERLKTGSVVITA